MIVHPKQQKIMKPIYNVWILLFCLTFTSCYEDDSIIRHQTHLHRPEDLSFLKEIILGTMMP